MRKGVAWIVGTAGGGLVFAFATFVGGAAGHGSDIPALMTIAPFSLFSNPLEGDSFVLPFIAFAFWGMVVALCRPGSDRRAVLFGLALLVVQLLSAILLQPGSIENRTLLYYSLAPYFIFVISILGSAVVALRKKTQA